LKFSGTKRRYRLFLKYGEVTKWRDKRRQKPRAQEKAHGKLQHTINKKNGLESVASYDTRPVMPDFQHSVSVAVTVAVAVAKYVRITFIRKNFVRTP